MAICKSCGADVARTAKICPKCGAKLKLSGCSVGCLTFLIIVWVVFITVVVVFNSISSPEKTNNNIEVQNTSNSDVITLDEFNALEIDMTYEQAVEIIGGEGILNMQSNVMDIEVNMYTWKGNGGFTSNANATFQNGKLTAKAQFGLK